MHKKTRRRRKKRSTLAKSFIKTRLVKKDVPADLIPLFNHCIRLARDSEKHGYNKRAGIELRHARRLTRYKKT